MLTWAKYPRYGNARSETNHLCNVLFLLMTRNTAALAAVSAICLSLIAAPASPASTAPAEFEITPPDRVLGSITRASSGTVSEPIEAPADFTMLGFHWNDGSDPAIAVRISEDGEVWSTWTPVPTQPDGGPEPGSGERRRAAQSNSVSSPVWAGESRFLQYRTAQSAPGMRIQLINTEALAKPAASSGFIDEPGDPIEDPDVDRPRADEQAAGEEEAPPRRPRNEDEEPVKVKGKIAKQVIARKKWDRGNDCKPRRKSREGDFEGAIVHHTVNANDYSRNESADMVLGICRFHRNGNGWDDIGYNFVVDKYGQIFEGRAGGLSRSNIGAHAVGFNEQTAGVANLGTFEKDEQSKDALKTEAALIEELGRIHDFKPDDKVKLVSGGGSGNRYPKGKKVKLNTISGHKDAGQTDCPGSKLYGQLKKLRKLAR